MTFMLVRKICLCDCVLVIAKCPGSTQTGNNLVWSSLWEAYAPGYHQTALMWQQVHAWTAGIA